MSKQMCLACSQREATSSDGTVPLCAQCAALAAGKGRGVQFDNPQEDKAGVKPPHEEPVVDQSK